MVAYDSSEFTEGTWIEPLQEGLKANLRRILSLCGVDEGFYVLALFSWIEAFIHAFDPKISYEYDSFADRLDHLFSVMGMEKCEYATLLYQLRGGYSITNRVRHQFETLSKGEALSMTHEFIRFCLFIGWHDAQLDRLLALRALWDEKPDPAREHYELTCLRRRIEGMIVENEHLRERIKSSQFSAEEFEGLKRELSRTTTELSHIETRYQKKEQKNDQLRKEVFDLREQKRTLEKRLEALTLEDEYLNLFRRLTVYTRSRGDYERSLMRMTGEQKRNLQRIGRKGDFLVRGGAGTGKTLVLLSSMIEDMKEDEGQLDLYDEGPRCLLTYTNALIHFDTYLVDLLSEGRQQCSLKTVDSFLFELLIAIEPDYRIDYGILSELLSDEPLPFMSKKELIAEIEHVLFGRAPELDRYLGDPSVRMGMRRALTVVQRQVVWELCTQLCSQMEAQRRLSKGYSRMFLLRYLESTREVPKRLLSKRLYVDEIQDLNPVELQLLSRLSSDGLVMAGDHNQTIYQLGFSFKHLGINIRGRSGKLRVNYRNTREILALAELYAQEVLGDEGLEADEDVLIDAFRTGPSPELWQEGNEESLLDTLLRRVCMFETLDYCPENIALLFPTIEVLNTAKGYLEKNDRTFVDIRSREFDFTTSQGLRVSTLHSAKGIEFPVVMLFIPQLPLSSRIDEESAVNSSRRLLYMAMTRCIDNLQVFTLKEPEQDPIKEFIEIFRRYRSNQLVG